VTNLHNGHSVTIRVNDRGPFAKGRIIDVSSKTADLLDMKQAGTAKVRVQYLGRARMDGRDMRYLMASYSRNGKKHRVKPTGGSVASGVMLALTAPKRTRMPEPAVQIASAAPLTSVPNTAVPLPAPERGAVKGGRLPVITELPVAVQETPLPQIGPVPRMRPEIAHEWLTGQGARSAELTSYVEQRLERRAATAMTLVLSRDEALTEALVAAAWKRQNP